MERGPLARDPCCCLVDRLVRGGGLLVQLSAAKIFSPGTASYRSPPAASSSGTSGSFVADRDATAKGSAAWPGVSARLLASSCSG